MKILQEIFHSNFARSVTMIAGGTALAQLLNAFLSPIITRLYHPQEYGVLTVYMAILGLITIVASLKYEWGIPIADDDKKAVNVMGLSFLVLATFVLLLTIIIFFFGVPFLNLHDAMALIKYKYLIPLGVFFIVTYNILIQWVFRRKNFKDIARTKLSQSVVGNGVKIGLGLFGAGPVGLIFGQILSQGAGIVTLSRSLRKDDRYLLKEINRKEIVWSAKRYKNFPIFTAPSQLFNTAGIQLPVFFITSLYGSQIVGLYGLANSVVSLPMVLIGRSVGDVFYAEAASVGRENPKKITDLSNKLFKRLVLIGLIPLLVLVFIGPFLFSFVFGSQWYEAGIYARILAFSAFASFIFTPISRIFSAFERQKEEFLLDLFRVILVFAAFGISDFFNLSSYLAVGLYSIAMSIIYLVTYLLAQNILKEDIKKRETFETA